MAKKRGSISSRRDNSELRDDRTNYFDKEFESAKRSQVYTTEKINQILKDIDDGVETDMMPFFHGKTQWKQADISFEYTAEEWAELEKCSDDYGYFIEKYCQFMTDYGRKTVQLRKYQKELIHLMGDEHYDEKLDLIVADNRQVVIMQSRQTGKTTTVSSFFATYICFHTDRNIMVVANKEQTAKEIFGKIKDVLIGLPFWIKPGVVSVSKETIKFENGCSLRCTATSDTPTTGDTLHLLMVDECALIPGNKIVPFWQSVYPTLSSSNVSQIIIMSTPRGKHNLFFDLYDGAIRGTNGFVYKRVDYWQVPGHDTEEWKQKQIAAFGEANFNQEFALSFESDASKLVSPNDLKFMERIKRFYRPVELYGIPYSVSSKILWHPDFHPESLRESDLVNSRFLLQVDTAEGKQKGEKGQEDRDWNVINIYQIEFLSKVRIIKNRLGYKKVVLKDCIRFRQVGIYMDQDFDEEKSAEAAKHIVFTLFRNGQDSYAGEIDNCRIMIEVNFNGVNWIKEFKKHDMFYTALIVKTYHSQKAKEKEMGFKTVSGEHGKGYFCELGAKYVASRQIIISQDHDIPTCSSIQQLEAFGKNKRGVYEGSCMHDDIAVTVLFVSIAMEQDEFINWIEEWFTYLTSGNANNLSEDYIKKLNNVAEMLNTYTIETTEEQYSEDEIMDLYSSSAGGFNNNPSMSSSMFGNNQQSYNMSPNNPYLNRGMSMPRPYSQMTPIRDPRRQY